MISTHRTGQWKWGDLPASQWLSLDKHSFLTLLHRPKGSPVETKNSFEVSSRKSQSTLAFNDSIALREGFWNLEMTYFCIHRNVIPTPPPPPNSKQCRHHEFGSLKFFLMVRFLGAMECGADQVDHGFRKWYYSYLGMWWFLQKETDIFWWINKLAICWHQMTSCKKLKKKLSAKQPLFLRASKNANAIKPKSWSEDKTGEWDYGEKPRALKNRFLEGKPNVSFFHLKSRKDTEKKTILTILSKNYFLQHQKSTVASTCFYY